MCGLAGGFWTPQIPSSKLASTIMMYALWQAEERGEDATGIATMGLDDETAPHVIKMAMAARYFLSLQAPSIAEHGVQTGLLMGHTRQYTHGSPKNPLNNHPLSVGTIVGAHNGILRHYEEQAQALLLDDKLQGQCDSELIFAVLEEENDFGASMAQQVRNWAEALPLIEGSMAITWMSARFPRHVFVARNNNPLVLVLVPEVRGIFWGSRGAYVLEAVAHLNLQLPADKQLTAQTWTVPANAIFVINDEVLDEALVKGLDLTMSEFEMPWGVLYDADPTVDATGVLDDDIRHYLLPSGKEDR